MSVFIIISISGQAQNSEGQLQGEPYLLTAENINYNQQSQIIKADKQVVFKYMDMKVEADSLIVDIRDKKLQAEGKEVILTTSSDQSFKGSRLEYDYDKGSGSFYEAESEIEELRFKGGVIELVDDKDYELELGKASFTSCIISEPHYQFKAESVKIYPDNKIIGKNIEFWWRNKRLFTLPAYKLLYEEVDGEYELSHPVPLPEVEYDSLYGLSFFLTYPYQIGERIQGVVKSTYQQRGEQSVTVDNNVDLTENTALKNSFSHVKELEDEDQADLPVSDREYIYTQEFYSGINYRTGGLNLTTGYKYNRETEENTKDITQKWSSTLGYSYHNFKINTGLDYDLDSKDREEDISVKYNNDKYRMNLSQEYLNESREKESYNLNYSQGPVNWNLIYRDGYDLNYYPYLTLDFPRIYNINTELSLGKVGEEGEPAVNKKSAGISYAQNLELREWFKLDFEGDMVYNLYDSNPQKRSLTHSISINSNFSQEISSDLDINSEIGWEQVENKGDFVISEDKRDTKNIIYSSTDLKYATPEPESYWNFLGDLKYSIKEQEWDEVKLGIKREYDCYSINFNYEIIDDIIGFGINF
ncbi:MAG: hypothetical protein ACOCRB_01125 [Halanaerobiaceae bacterium]